MREIIFFFKKKKTKKKKKRCGFISQFGLRPPIDQPFFLSPFQMVKNVPDMGGHTLHQTKYGVLLFSQVQRRRFLSTNHTRNNDNKKTTRECMDDERHRLVCQTSQSDVRSRKRKQRCTTVLISVFPIESLLFIEERKTTR